MNNSKDSTFLIPIRIDSEDRQKNVNSLVLWILKETCSCIIILEADSQKRLSLQIRSERIAYYYVQDNDIVFHRTYYINILLSLAKTPIVGVWDADVIVSQKQMLDAISLIKNKQAIIVSPFDGTCRLLSKETSLNFRNELDYSILENCNENQKLYYERPSWGGAFFVDKEAYVNNGGENENFYGWGPEDIERKIRSEVLGFSFLRVSGVLFHLFHTKNESSGNNNLTIQYYNKYELAKISTLNKLEMRDYITLWSKEFNVVYVYLIGRIGNLMFQLAAAASVAKENKCRVIGILSDYWAPFPDNCILSEYIKQFKDNIFKDIVVLTKMPARYRLHIEPYFHYAPIEYKKNILLYGMFQSEKYLDRKLVLDLFKIDIKTQVIIQHEYGHILKMQPTAVNIRRGDYVNYSKKHPICEIEYFHKAISIIGKDSPFLVISDDIEWCKLYFIGDNFFFTEKADPVIDLYLQSLCSNNIISNSSFSWWGAWLNLNPNKIVIAPRKWFGEEYVHLDTIDLIPSSWIQI